jgi:hypothetical protein
VKALFGDDDTNQALKLGAVNSINFSRILAQIVYYFYSYFTLVKKSDTLKLGDKVRFVVPTGNFVSRSPSSTFTVVWLISFDTGRYISGLFCVPHGLAR